MQARLSCPKRPPSDAMRMFCQLVGPEPAQNTQHLWVQVMIICSTAQAEQTIKVKQGCVCGTLVTLLNVIQHVLHVLQAVGFGGGMRSTLTNAVIANNTAHSVIAVMAGSSLAVTNSYNVTNNNVGEGVFRADEAQLSILSSNAINNNASICGGVVSSFCGKLNIHNSSFSANHGDMGGVVCTACLPNGDFVMRVNLTKADFTSNTASNSGGALAGQATTMVVKSCTFTKNVAPRGGRHVMVGGRPGCAHLHIHRK